MNIIHFIEKKLSKNLKFVNKITLQLSEANNGGRLSFRYIIYTFCLLLAEYMFLQGTSIMIRNRLLKNKIIMIEIERGRFKRTKQKSNYKNVLTDLLSRIREEKHRRCRSVRFSYSSFSTYQISSGVFFLFMFQRCQLLVKMSTVRFTSSQNKK